MISKNQIKFIRSLELKKNRKQNGLFVAEGPKVVGDLLHADYKARMLFATKPYPGAELITDDELQRISFLQHPQEILAVFEMPTRNSQPSTLNSQPSTLNSQLIPEQSSPTRSLSTLNSQLSLALDGIQDPGNLGTIIRIADWFGISTIYCSPETADVYNPKVVQATMGSLAHVQVVYTDLLALVSQLPPSYPVYGTLLDGENIYQQELTSEGIIVMGKPHDAAEAHSMLHQLSGKTHQVITGVCLTTKERQVSFSVETDVTFKKLTDEEIDYYVDHYRPFDKAGAYGIQEWIGHVGVTGMNGSYFNVMGLPVQRIYEALKGFTE